MVYSRSYCGRNGHVKSNNNVLDVQVRIPKALGGINDSIQILRCCSAGYAAALIL
jgi:hypothetical protein